MAKRYEVLFEIYELVMATESPAKTIRSAEMDNLADSIGVFLTIHDYQVLRKGIDIAVEFIELGMSSEYLAKLFREELEDYSDDDFFGSELERHEPGLFARPTS